MTEENVTRVQLSIKFGSNGSGYAIVEARTTEALMEEAQKLMDEAGRLNAVVEEIQARSTFANAGMTTQQIPAPQDPGTPYGPKIPNCAHGIPRRQASGMKNGKRWSAQFCDEKHDPRLAQCDPIWTN